MPSEAQAVESRASSYRFLLDVQVVQRKVNVFEPHHVQICHNCRFVDGDKLIIHQHAFGKIVELNFFHYH